MFAKTQHYNHTQNLIIPNVKIMYDRGHDFKPRQLNFDAVSGLIELTIQSKCQNDKNRINTSGLNATIF